MPNTQNEWTQWPRARSALGTRMHLDVPSAPYPPTIMLVDRSKSTPDMAALLRSMGYRVRAATERPPYSQEMRTANPDIFVYVTDSADRAMWDALQALRAQTDLPFVPVILYIHRISPSDRRRARFLNVADCLTMPFEPDDLVAAISNIISLEHSLQRQQHLFENQLRHEILGMVQHEFRTPLTVLMGFAELLGNIIDENPEPQDIRLALEGIVEGSNRLHSLVENLILLTELLQREISRDEVYAVDAIDLWREAINTLNGHHHEARGIYLIPPDEPLQIVGAPELICEALVRLLDTTIRQEGSSNRRINLMLTAGVDMIGWRVHTEGGQLVGNQAAHVVQPYAFEEANTPLHDMLGLGLAIVEQVARMHGGRVTHESIEDQGEMLTMWLPLVPLPHLQRNDL